MGKKSRAKRQRERVRQHAQQPTQNGQATFRISSQSESILNQPMSTVTSTATAAASPSLSKPGSAEDYVRKDIVRMLILLTGVAIVLITLFVINLKSPVLRNAGARLSSFLELKQN